jgi:hypothetical protein
MDVEGGERFAELEENQKPMQKQTHTHNIEERNRGKTEDSKLNHG